MNTYEFHYCKIILPNSSLILLWLRAVCNRMKLYKLLLHVKQKKNVFLDVLNDHVKEKRIISFKICPNKRNFSYSIFFFAKFVNCIFPLSYIFSRLFQKCSHSMCTFWVELYSLQWCLFQCTNLVNYKEPWHVT